MWSLGSTKINPLYLCRDEDFVCTQAFDISKLPLKLSSLESFYPFALISLLTTV